MVQLSANKHLNLSNFVMVPPSLCLGNANFDSLFSIYMTWSAPRGINFLKCDTDCSYAAAAILWLIQSGSAAAQMLEEIQWFGKNFFSRKIECIQWPDSCLGSWIFGESNGQLLIQKTTRAAIGRNYSH